MTFLAIDAQKNLFTLQKSQLQYERTLVMSRVNYITRQMADIARACDQREEDPDDDPMYQALQKDEAYLESRQDSLESQITALDNEISSLKTLVQNNIKSACQLSLLGG